MNVLICGLGSIGQRHVRILKKIYKNKINLFCLRNTNRNLIIDDNLKAKKIKSIEDYYNIKKINNIKEHKFIAVYITNPINKHIEYALKFAKLGCNIFLEKPLSNNLKNVDKLIKIVKKKKITIQIGYQLKFHPGIIILKNIISKNVLGAPISGTFYYGENLPLTRQYEDYSKTHMAIKKLGGGATLCLSHQIDLISYLIGDIKILWKYVSKISDLKIDTDDICKVIFEDKKKSKFYLQLNFLDQPKDHFIFLNFKKGTVKWNYFKNTIAIYNNMTRNTKVIRFKKFKRNDLFKAQSIKFFNNIKNHKSNINNLVEAKKILKIIKTLKS